MHAFGRESLLYRCLTAGDAFASITDSQARSRCSMNKSALATILGYAGLIPFLAGTAALFSNDPSISGPALYSLTVYAAVILAFMGAIHWGLAMQAHGAVGNWQLGLSVLPALAAWLSLSLQTPRESFITLTLAFVVLLIADLYAIARHLAPPWYRQLRIPLTLIVVCCLSIAAWRVG